MSKRKETVLWSSQKTRKPVPFRLAGSACVLACVWCSQTYGETRGHVRACFLHNSANLTPANCRRLAAWLERAAKWIEEKP